MIYRFLTAWVLWLAMSVATFAQDVASFVSIAPTPHWVKALDFSKVPALDKTDNSIDYLFVDNQYRNSLDTNSYYLKRVQRFNTPRAVEDHSAVTVNFDPTYETVRFHELALHRGDETIDLLSLEHFDLYRLETQRELLIYNGRLELASVLPGLRSGDVLEYSYTIDGGNPALERNFGLSFQHQFGVPVALRSSRLSLEEGRAVHFKPHLGAAEPVVTTADGFVDYQWTEHDVDGVETDDDYATGYSPYPHTQFSSFETWGDVGKFFAPSYDAAGFQSEAIDEIATEIKSGSSSKKVQIREALRFVHDNVRYLGIELGAGGYIPRTPDSVLERRFGDCKDMVVLLNSILFALEIDAKPVLVSFDLSRHLEDHVPAHNAFDHVITMVQFEGQTYMLDPTTGPQLGDLDHLQQADFGQGVPVENNSSGLIDVVAPLPEWHRRTEDVYNIKDIKRMTFSTTVTHEMSEADRLFTWKERSGLDEIEKSYLDFYRRQFPNIEQDGPFGFAVDEARARVTIKAKYIVPNPFHSGEEGAPEDDTSGELSYWADDIGGSLETEDNSERLDPYQVPKFPIKISQKSSLIAAVGFEVDPWLEEIEAPGVKFKQQGRTDFGAYQQENQLTFTDDRIDASEYADYMKAVGKINNLTWTYYSLPEAELWFIEEADNIAVLYFVALILISALVVYLARNDDADDRDQQVFFPVSMTKFIVMSVVSIGIYQIYWVYKNWVWIRSTKHEDISPFWRMFFVAFTNISLFPRIANHEPASSRLVRTIAPILALMYLLSAIVWRLTSDVFDTDVSITLFGLTGFVWMFPIAREVLRKNEQNTEFVQKNSKFGWAAIAMIVFSLPVSILMCVGLFWPQ